MNLPTTKPNQYDLSWYIRECAALQRENVALREKARLWEETCHGLSAPHYILDPDLRASKFREALRSYSVVVGKTGSAIGLAQKEAQP